MTIANYAMSQAYRSRGVTMAGIPITAAPPEVEWNVIILLKASFWGFNPKSPRMLDFVKAHREWLLGMPNSVDADELDKMRLEYRSSLRSVHSWNPLPDAVNIFASPEHKMMAALTSIGRKAEPRTVGNLSSSKSDYTWIDDQHSVFDSFDLDEEDILPLYKFSRRQRSGETYAL